MCVCITVLNVKYGNILTLKREIERKSEKEIEIETDRERSIDR